MKLLTLPFDIIQKILFALYELIKLIREARDKKNEKTSDEQK